MPVSTLTSKGQTTVPKKVREALDLEPGAKLRWEVRGGKVAVTTDRPATTLSRRSIELANKLSTFGLMPFF